MAVARIDNHALHYDDRGTGSPVLLLHGLGSTGHEWELVAPGLAARHRCIVPDVRGHGRSDKPAGSYSVPLFARDIAALCDELGLSSLHVLGLSMGGMIAFQLAITRPDLVRSLVIINSGPEMVPRTWQAALAVAQRLAVVTLFGPRRFASMLGPRLFPRPEQADRRIAFEETVAANDRSAYRRATFGLIGWSVLDRLDEVICPVLVLASERDYTTADAKRLYVERLGDARLVEIGDSGHLATLDQPDRVLDETTRFLEDVEGRADEAAEDARREAQAAVAR
jgi:pimeloyl-ACP methyl ester carboxylesterase